jgi:hypothetical protein
MNKGNLPACSRLLFESRRQVRNQRKCSNLAAGAFSLVTLTTNQVETFFGELEYLEPRLKALGVLDSHVM